MNYLTRIDLLMGDFMDMVFRLRKSYQPVDLARMLMRAVIENERKTLTRTYVPNAYAILLAAEDLERLEPIRGEIVADLRQAIAEFVERQEVFLNGPLRLDLEASPAMQKGQVRIRALFIAEA